MFLVALRESHSHSPSHCIQLRQAFSLLHCDVLCVFARSQSNHYGGLSFRVRRFGLSPGDTLQLWVTNDNLNASGPGETNSYPDWVRLSARILLLLYGLRGCCSHCLALRR